MIEELFKDTTMTKSQEDSINYIDSNKDYIVNSYKDVKHECSMEQAISHIYASIKLIT